MQIVRAYPPLYQEIARTFDLAGVKPVFAWGEKIFNPHGGQLGAELIAHERVHGERQLAHPAGVVGWWQDYLRDPQFRLAEEILAHRAEYHAYCDGPRVTRNQRRIVLRHMAQRLAARMYGSLISIDDAKKAILDPDFAPIARTTAPAARDAGAPHPPTH